MPVKKPKILILFAREGTETSTTYGGFVKRIKRYGGFQNANVEYAALENLTFHIKDKKVARVYDSANNIDVGSYSFVYLKSWQSLPVLAASVAHFLESKGIPYADHQARHEYIAKTTNYMTMWSSGVSVPETIWGSSKVLLAYVRDLDEAAFPIIIKAVHGQKGQDNYLVKSRDEALAILEEATIEMLIQQFIPNDGDYRIGVYGNKARWAIYRQSNSESHLNNTSSGALASNIPIDEVPVEVRRLAEDAAAACDLSFSGVDIVEDKETKKLYVFEANQGSQIVTGAFTETNVQAFSEGMESMVAPRFKGGNAPSKRPQLIGRLVKATIKTGAGDLIIRAKVDSGAYQSAIDSKDVKELVDSTGKTYLQYTLHDQLLEEPVTIQTYDFGRASIRSSTGHMDRRYVVPMVIEINGKEYNTRVTLANRSGQKNRMLIGRQLLRGNFLINVELGL